MSLHKIIKFPSAFLFAATNLMLIHSISAQCGKTLIMGGITASEKQIILDVHNKMRQVVALGQISNQPPAANMLKLTWSDDLARKAQEFAVSCSTLKHDPSRHYGDFFVGQNTASRWTTRAPRTYQDGRADWYTDALAKWFDEHADYRFSGHSGQSFGRGPIGHYTQVVWAQTATVGCGYAYYVDAAKRYTKRYVCNYGPSGNVQGQEPYDKGYSNCLKYDLTASRSYPGLCEVGISHPVTSYKNSYNYNKHAQSTNDYNYGYRNNEGYYKFYS